LTGKAVAFFAFAKTFKNVPFTEVSFAFPATYSNRPQGGGRISALNIYRDIAKGKVK